MKKLPRAPSHSSPNFSNVQNCLCNVIFIEYQLAHAFSSVQSQYREHTFDKPCRLTEASLTFLPYSGQAGLCQGTATLPVTGQVAKSGMMARNRYLLLLKPSGCSCNCSCTVIEVLSRCDPDQKRYCLSFYKLCERDDAEQDFTWFCDCCSLRAEHLLTHFDSAD